MTARASYRVGVDIGGTFTDIVVATSEGELHSRKVSSTPDDYSRGMVEGVGGLLKQLGGSWRDVTELVHATTVATNTILEGKGAVTALVTTRGFRDVLEIGRLRRPNLYDLSYRKPTPLVPRRRRHEITERLGPGGEVVIALDDREIAAIATQLRACGAEAVAISLLHSYANPDHEIRIRDRLAAELPETVFITASHDLLPEIREYERTSTTVVNAYVGPVVKRYLTLLQQRLREVEMRGRLEIMQSNGGVISAEAAIAKPASIIESGPAAGVIAAARAARLALIHDQITLDMGGTTAKAAMIEAGAPARTTEYEVGAGINISSKLVKGGGHAVKLPYIDVSEIGAGGGSIVRRDPGGLFHVGPDSAGSMPGPVCYDHGGNDVTLTDALVTLGYVNPAFIAGGEVLLKAEKAREALRSKLAEPAALDVLEAAYGIYQIAGARMMRAVKAVSTYRGRDPRDFTLFAFGGNGPLMALQIAELAEMRRVVIPPHPGVFSALGLLYSQTQHERIQTFYGLLRTMDLERMQQRYERLEQQVGNDLRRDGHETDDVRLQRYADLRYEGQAFELSVPVTEARIDAASIAAVTAAFHEEHERTYGYRSLGNNVELVNIRVVGSTKVTADTGSRSQSLRRRKLAPGLSVAAARLAYFGRAHGLIETPVVDRIDLLGRERAGPLIVEEYDATCVIPPGWRVSLDELCNLTILAEGTK